jgi:lipopolysaccharide export system permease protein
VGKGGFTVVHAVLAALLEAPGHFYELFPIAVLIGTIYAMARWRSRRSSPSCAPGGLGPGRALRLLAAWAGVRRLTFVVGDYVAPTASSRPWR